MTEPSSFNHLTAIKVTTLAMSHGKQFTLYSHHGGPNGWKVAFLLEELALTYETKYLDFPAGEHKAAEYLKINPNGRIPALVDHKNDDYTIWESDAILLYLVDKYDTEKKFTVTEEGDKYHLIQWLFFQASGQGPYYGQATHFMKYHPERVQSAIDRYKDEVRRVLGVLETVLSKQEWLVGGKYTIADLSFVSWNVALSGATFTKEDPSFNWKKEYPSVAKWHDTMRERLAMKKCFEIHAQLVASQ
ncbi:glutathione S-transferase C-terminal-like protein [Panus rudis PR-1116 ss-1]|nr:glutathione S-transferase C-terminal-like protein [Panus rudis PR-1116 ss-1]